MPRVTRQHILLRMGAFLIDALLIALILILPASLLSWIVIYTGGVMNWIARIWNVAFVLYLLAILFRDGWKGRSLGKLIMGLRLLGPGGGTVGALRSFGRNLPLIVPGLNFVEVALLIFGSEGRRLGDRLARTTVVEG